MVNGLAGEDKIELVVEIQSHVRRIQASHRVSNIKACRELNEFATTIINNYPQHANEEVHNIIKRLGAFDFGDVPGEYANRSIKRLVILENGSKYEGQWNENTG